MVKKHVRVRMPPSPTGLFHIGSARTALFNWLFVKKHGGAFILRIEDTDKERSRPEFEKDIMENLHWLGLDWDEGPAEPSANRESQSAYKGDYGPYRQSERGDIYERYIRKLLDENHAYYCFCAKEDLEAERESMLANGQAPRYGGKCRNLPKEEVETKLKKGEGHVIRFKIPEKEISFTDIIRGRVSFDMSLAGDIVIAKDEKSPLYSLAVVIDDYEMKITHVIRGEDHLANTPKQIAMANALNFPIPEFAHLPLILNADRSKMSKRFEAVAVSDYRKEGYLAEALINFIALLGWHPEALTDPKTGKKEEKEILTREELIEKFSLERVQKGGAIFNKEKLDWLNSHYLRNLSNPEILQKLTGLMDLPDDIQEEKILKAIGIVKDRMKKLSDFKELAYFIFGIPDYEPELLIWKSTPQTKILENLNELLKGLSQIETRDFTLDKLNAIINPIAEKLGKGETFWPFRVALSGHRASPGPIEIMEAIGKKETIKRLESAITKISSGGTRLKI